MPKRPASKFIGFFFRSERAHAAQFLDVRALQSPA